jgi:hypothetical protein
MRGKAEPTVGSEGSFPRRSHSSRAACILAARSTFWIRCLARRASRLARRCSLVGVGFTVAAKADLSSGFADNGCGFLVVPHAEAILAGELFVHRRETDVSALDWAAHAMEARTDESRTVEAAAL